MPIIGGTTQPEVHQSIFEGVFHRELNEQFNLINYIELYVEEFDYSLQGIGNEEKVIEVPIKHDYSDSENEMHNAQVIGAVSYSSDD